MSIKFQPLTFFLYQIPRFPYATQNPCLTCQWLFTICPQPTCVLSPYHKGKSYFCCICNSRTYLLPSEKESPSQKIQRDIFLSLQIPLLLQHIHANGSGQVLGEDNCCHLQKTCANSSRLGHPIVFVTPSCSSRRFLLSSTYRMLIFTQQSLYSMDNHLPVY